jgi:aspartyl protease family protein
VSGAEQINVLWLLVLLAAIVFGGTLWRSGGLGVAVRNALIWILIFAGLFLAAVAYKDSDLMLRARGELMPDAPQVVGGEMRVTAREDGHFWIRGTLNGHDTLFLIDTGASDIVLTRATADAAGIDVAALKFDRGAMTANGPVAAARATVGTLRIGAVERRDMPVSITAGQLEVNLLGMTWLRTLKSWRVERDTLIMTV